MQNQQLDPIRPIIIEIEKLKQNQQFKEAVEKTKSAIVKYKDDYRLYEELADTYLYLWKVDEAEAAIDYALKQNSKSATGHYLKGFLCLNRDAYKEALKHLEFSNSMMWNNPEVLRNLGWAYTMNNEPQRWISILKRALNLAPWDKLITEDLAMAYIWIWEVELGNKLLREVWSDKVYSKKILK